MTQLVKIKRSTVANHEPTLLAEGELALNLADDPIKMWVGTSSGIKRLFAGEAVEDAPDDAVYGRSDGEWIAIPIIAADLPVDPPPNALWFDSSNGRLYLFFQTAWVEVARG